MDYGVLRRTVVALAFVTTAVAAESPERRGLDALKAGDKAHDSAHFDLAVKEYQKALAIFQSAGLEDRVGQVRLHTSILYYNLGQLDRAERAANEALAVGEKYPEKLWTVTAQALMILGNISFDRGRNADALDFYQKAGDISDAHGSRSFRARVNYEIGFWYWSNGEYRKAIEYCERCLKQGEALKNDDLQADGLIALGNIYLELNQYRQSRDHFERALEITTKEDDPYNMAVVYDGLAFLYSSLQDYDKAMNIRLSSMRNAERVGSEKLLGEVYESVAHEYLTQNDLARAERYAEKAEFYSKKTQQEQNLVWVYQDLTLLRSRQGRHADAIAAGKSGLRLAKQRNDLEQIWGTYGLLGDAMKAAGDQQGALACYLSAIETIEAGRTAIRQVGQRSAYMTNKQSVYGNAAALLVQTGRTDDAFLVSEKYRSRAFLEMLQHPSLESRPQLQSDPLLQAFFFPRFTGVRDVQRDILGEHEAFVEYLAGQDRVLGILILKDRVIAKDLGPRIPIERRIERYLEFLSQDAPVFEGKTGGRTLYNELLEPLLPPDHAPLARLVVSPDSILHLLPFETLVAPDGRFLIQDTVVSYASSATILRKLDERRREAEPLRLVAVANPEEVQEDDLSADLPYSIKEVEAVGSFFGPLRVILTGRDATRENFFRQDLSQPTVFHFATHTIIDENDPLRSRIVMHAESESGDLMFNDLLGKKWISPMAVLSACGSGRGRIVRGEGLDGFSRSLFYSGVNSLVVTLWNVEDESAYVLMHEFYRALAEGLPIDQSLRLAKLARIDQHPARWAAFVCSGVSDETLFGHERTTQRLWWSLIIGLGLIAAAAAVLAVYRKPKRLDITL
ncbi:MAG: CHAT domain-containing protein [Acidobacteriota bacterium]